ncbi:hypothetical protein C3486_03650 [Streptomyces sp. Ru73]|uniref:hypothetical protein n=1 Tax=Streptomyces sp. Ru73 TaxID=2080748 RepID=UPI000CDD39C8|nr:hypothetical protein [Streptomyces sp. Ru73]POX42678.1 hypothetical protein C3486_03650 [Streptomyces sp. Ru73]
MRCYWDEEDTWFYFEVDAQGWVQRQVELQGPEATPLVAASLAEWQRAHDAGRPAAYERRFGLTAEPPVPDWEGHHPEYLTANDFEQIWAAARKHLTARPN